MERSEMNENNMRSSFLGRIDSAYSSVRSRYHKLPLWALPGHRLVTQCTWFRREHGPWSVGQSDLHLAGSPRSV